jgi:hypothetical protein
MRGVMSDYWKVAGNSEKAPPVNHLKLCILHFAISISCQRNSRITLNRNKNYASSNWND